MTSALNTGNISSMRFTILLPVHRPPAMLAYAIESVLSQELKSFELLVIGDGAPESTIECANRFARRDPRVQVMPFPKGAMCGEAHRHSALANAQGTYIAHMADDDLWFPNHLVELDKLLCQVDFGHLIHVYADLDGSFEILPSDLTDVRLRNRMLTEQYNTLGDAVTGYRLSAYRKLPEGWAPPPEMAHPDLKMWRKFLRRSDLSFGTRAVVTALNFATDRRPQMTLEERGRENERWWRRIMDPQARAEIVERAWLSLSRLALHSDQASQDRLLVIHELQAKIDRLESLRDFGLELGNKIDFSANGNSPLYALYGWGSQDSASRWTVGKEAKIAVCPQLFDIDRGINLHLYAYAFDGPQRITISVDAAEVAKFEVGEVWGEYVIHDVFSGSEHRKTYEISFLLPDAHSPKSVGLSEDARALGIAVSSIAFLPSFS